MLIDGMCQAVFLFAFSCCLVGVAGASLFLVFSHLFLVEGAVRWYVLASFWPLGTCVFLLPLLLW